MGHDCCEDPLVLGHDDKVKHALKILIAASLAESKHIGSRTCGDADDRVKATKLALLATDRDTERAEALLNEMVGEARKLVEKYWPDIEELAAADRREDQLFADRARHRARGLSSAWRATQTVPRQGSTLVNSFKGMR